jgi:hypothetical protein
MIGDDAELPRRHVKDRAGIHRHGCLNPLAEPAAADAVEMNAIDGPTRHPQYGRNDAAFFSLTVTHRELFLRMTGDKRC